MSSSSFKKMKERHQIDITERTLLKIKEKNNFDDRKQEKYELKLTQKIQKPKDIYAYEAPIPDHLWIKCPHCDGGMFREHFERSHSVCPLCKYHYRLDSEKRIAMIADHCSFVEMDEEMQSMNPLGFPQYDEKQVELRQKTKINDAIRTGKIKINGQECLIAVMDARYMMGSMGSVVGEKLCRLFERGAEEKLAVITFAASGGARMQEGIISLMQMAKTAAAINRLKESGGLYISVMTDPTTGGVTASFASLGDFIIAEPGTLIGFAGRRVIEGTIAQELPEGFQRAEFLLKHGFLDFIIERSKMKDILSQLLSYHQQGTVNNKKNKKTLTSLSEVQSKNKTINLKQQLGGKKGKALTAAERLCLVHDKSRPTIEDYLMLIFDEVIELHGDRCYGDDAAMFGGLAMLKGQAVTVLGHRKGHNLNENTNYNFAMTHPEGYRKAQRLMQEAERFNRPIICFVDTPGAYCGVGAEERGQGEAIAKCIADIMQVKVPVIVVVTGEGGSGGALAIGVGNEIAMLSNALYSVISPRGFSSLLWKDPTREMEAANVMKITAEDLKGFGICDYIIPEPDGGAQKDTVATAVQIKDYLAEAMERLKLLDAAALVEQRYAKIRDIGYVR